MSVSYDKAQLIKYSRKLNELRKLLPEFTDDFFIGISDNTQIRTRIAYAFDLRIFFYYLFTCDEKFKARTSERDFTMEDLDLIKARDLDHYMAFLGMYEMPHYKDETKIITYTNSASGKMRKLSSLRSFYKYFYKRELIRTNPTLLVDLPKIHEKPIVRLDSNEVADLLDSVESGEKLTSKQQCYHSRTAKRDLAIIALLLGTGIRISECVGLDRNDFDFTNDSFTVTRKGGDRAILFLSKEVSEILQDYLKNYRNDILPIYEQDVDAMFLSLQKRRMTVSSIEKMVKKYTKSVVPLKNISPHKFRSTFGTNLYKESNDIYLVADVLGHADVNTTKKHYAAIEEDRRKVAAKLTKLRED